MNTFTRRLNDPSRGAIVVVEQRTHDDDITGWLLKNEPGQWTHVVIPLEQEKERIYVYPRSGKVFVRPSGDVLQPARFPPEVIQSRRVHLRTFSTQDQQKPAPDEGEIFKREWWRYRDTPRDKYDQIITTWDFAVEGNADSDYNCGICLGKIGADVDILDVFKKRISFPLQLQAFKDFAKKHFYATRHLVEKKANGPAVVSFVHASVSGVIAVEPQGSKFQRADAATPECESGNVYLLKAPWNLDFTESLAMFPNGANDDDVDAFAQGINWLREHVYCYGLLGYAAQQVATLERLQREAMESPKFIKPESGAQTVRCGKCESMAVVKIGNIYRCNGCQNQWPVLKTAEFDPKIFERPSMRKGVR